MDLFNAQLIRIRHGIRTKPNTLVCCVRFALYFASETSIDCPLVAGVTALLKSIRTVRNVAAINEHRYLW